MTELEYVVSSVNTKVIVISGSMGSGKTTVLGESSDVLTSHHIPHATVDLDAVGTALLPDEVARDVTSRSLAAVYATVASVGITRVLIAEAVEQEEH
jgi:Ni2+-binding GTPase involved in maturation of urease and hydrogenase